MQLPEFKEVSFSSDVENQLSLVFEKHKEYFQNLRKFNCEVAEISDTDFNLFMLSMLHVYNGFLDTKLSELNIKLKYL